MFLFYPNQYWYENHRVQKHTPIESKQFVLRSNCNGNDGSWSVFCTCIFQIQIWYVMWFLDYVTAHSYACYLLCTVAAPVQFSIILGRYCSSAKHGVRNTQTSNAQLPPCALIMHWIHEPRSSDKNTCRLDTKKQGSLRWMHSIRSED